MLSVKSIPNKAFKINLIYLPVGIFLNSSHINYKIVTLTHYCLIFSPPFVCFPLLCRLFFFFLFVWEAGSLTLKHWETGRLVGVGECTHTNPIVNGSFFIAHQTRPSHTDQHTPSIFKIGSHLTPHSSKVVQTLMSNTPSTL